METLRNVRTEHAEQSPGRCRVPLHKIHIDSGQTTRGEQGNSARDSTLLPLPIQIPRAHGRIRLQHEDADLCSKQGSSLSQTRPNARLCRIRSFQLALYSCVSYSRKEVFCVCWGQARFAAHDYLAEQQPKAAEMCLQCLACSILGATAGLISA